ncbi:MAG: HlyD family efflux transporter periplasmic adaptor subunit [Planctomycetaceae bacterium]
MNGPSNSTAFNHEYAGQVGAAERAAFRFHHRTDSPQAATNQVEGSGRPPEESESAALKPTLQRPRGRMLIAILMLAACASGVLTVWDNLFRYKAYGVVTGRIIDVATPIDGILESVHVREGQVVHQNTLLAKVSDLEYEQKLERIADELRIVEATLTAEMARIKWQSHVDETEMTRAIAEFHEATGTIHKEHGTLEILRDQLERTRIEREQRATTASDLIEKTIEERSHAEKLESLHESLTVLKERAQRAEETPRLGTEQIEPISAKADSLLNEIDRIREWMAQGMLKAPVNGIVLRRHHPAGECIKSHEQIFSVLEEGTVEIELFVHQDISDTFEVGDRVNLNIEPFKSPVECEVIAIGSEHRRPPEHIEIFYRSNVRLLPVKLRPTGPEANDARLRIGAVARLPHIGARG